MAQCRTLSSPGQWELQVHAVKNGTWIPENRTNEKGAYLYLLKVDDFFQCFLHGDVLLYAVNIYFYYWMMREAVSANGQAGHSQAGSISRSTRTGECWEEVGRAELPERCHVAAKGARGLGITGKPRQNRDT